MARLALAGFIAAIDLVDDIEPTAPPDHAIIAMALAQGSKRIFDLHGKASISTGEKAWRPRTGHLSQSRADHKKGKDLCQRPWRSASRRAQIKRGRYFDRSDRYFPLTDGARGLVLFLLVHNLEVLVQDHVVVAVLAFDVVGGKAVALGLVLASSTVQPIALIAFCTPSTCSSVTAPA
jgi:hypothetical protein